MIRTLFFFQDGNQQLVEYNNGFFPLSRLLSRLISKFYPSKNIKQINIDFSSESTYMLFPLFNKCYIHKCQDFISYNDVIDFEKFQIMSYKQKNIYLWTRAYYIYSKIAMEIKNVQLLEATKKAFENGYEIKLCPDYKVIEEKIELFGIPLVASIWIKFDEKYMYSSFALEKNKVVIYNKYIDKAMLGNEFFTEIY